MINFLKILLLFLLSSLFFLLIFFNSAPIFQIIMLIIISLFTAIYCFISLLSEEVIEDIVEEIENIEDDTPNNSTIEILTNNLYAVKVNNINNLNPNFSSECCICLELIDPIDSFKLSNCDFHIYHENCINLYLENNFRRCPVCNI